MPTGNCKHCPHCERCYPSYGEYIEHFRINGKLIFTTCTASQQKG
jgi:hypothetical protein